MSDLVPTFDDWSGIAQSAYQSPAVPTPLDYVRKWTGPNGTSPFIVIKWPVFSNPAVIKISPTGDLDARPVFEQALAKARAEKINRIEIEKGVYKFLSIDSTNQHLLISKAKDLLIEGNGSKFVFSQNNNGLVIRQSQRVAILNLTMDYDLLCTSVGSINSDKKLVIDSKFPVTAADQIFQLAEVDQYGHFIPGGVRIITPPGTSLPLYETAQTYSYKDFIKLPTGTRFLVIHKWYGGSAIKIDGDRDALQTEDISFDNITINATPGIAVAVTGLKRGFSFIGSKLVPAMQGRNAVGPSWDGIHINSGGGDILIQGNRFSYLGDDAINISNPIHPIESIVGSTLLFTTSSRFMAKGDTLCFFDGDGAFIGKAQIILDTVNKGAGKFEVTVDALPAAVTVQTFARDVSLMASRFYVAQNTIEDCNVHGLLCQISNGVIEGNSFRRLGKNPMRLLSSIGPWNEGVGVFNVAIRNNLIEDCGIDFGYGVKWGAISIYGQRKDGLVSERMFHEHLEISGNVMRGLRQEGISVSNARHVIIGGNICEKL